MIATQLRLAARNSLRRKVRTGLTAGMVVAGVSLLLLLLTWVNGATQGMLGGATAAGGHVRVVDPDYSAREELAPLEENIPEVAPLVEALREQPGVVAVEPRITAGVSVTVGDEAGEVFARAVGARASYFRERLAAHDKLIAGAWLGGAQDEIVLGANVAEDADATIGDRVRLLGTTRDGSLSAIEGTVVGIVRGDGELNQLVLAPLATLQRQIGIPAGATEVLIYGAEYESAGELASSLREVPALASYAVEAWSEREPWRSMAASAEASQSAIVLIMVLLVALGIWNTMMMSVLERTHEIGVLRALGMSRLAVVGLFVGEAIAIGVVGGALGVALGAIPSYLLEKHGLHIGEQAAANNQLAMSSTIYGDLSVEGVVMAFGLGLLMATLGSLLPSLRAASIPPVSAMRSGR